MRTHDAYWKNNVRKHSKSLFVYSVRGGTVPFCVTYIIQYSNYPCLYKTLPDIRCQNQFTPLHDPYVSGTSSSALRPIITPNQLCFLATTRPFLYTLFTILTNLLSASPPNVVVSSIHFLEIQLHFLFRTVVSMDIRSSFPQTWKSELQTFCCSTFLSIFILRPLSHFVRYVYNYISARFQTIQSSIKLTMLK